MAQRILEPGQIERLAKSSIPRVRLPVGSQLFARRAARLRELAAGAAIGDYLRLLAVLAESQHGELARLAPVPPAPAAAPSAAAPCAATPRALSTRTPPIAAASATPPSAWRDTLTALCAAIASQRDFPAGVEKAVAAIGRATPAWVDSQARSILRGEGDRVDVSVAPLLMAALQVHWVGMAACFEPGAVKPLVIPGQCPLCGMLPVASVVCACAPYQGYRYLHCALCATEWHMVRVQCSHCGASGPPIAYHSLDRSEADLREVGSAAVRAETCDECRAYRKILYEECDSGVDAVADDVASLSLDLLLAERGYHRASGNPLLWLTNANRPS
ncbi:MAG TPA: formate dehydrogenase accessory protein FdhE [Steroidobacteraceae bacterium]|nr:formate dehydrogenase accessory protein FdhE [Steroidobacteraceae bacterium]